MSDSIKVAIRIRPLVESEIQRGCQSCVEALSESPQIVVRGQRAFTFNYVFDQDSNQQDVYECAVQSLVYQLFKGYNVTVLAYGQTGSGKTHTMGSSAVCNGHDVGVIPRAVQDIFDYMKDHTDWEFKICVSFMELYKEQLFDLLSAERAVVEIREDTKGICIPTLTEVAVTSPESTLRCLQSGSLGRVTGATAMNSQSSRSHAIFTITVQQQMAGNPHSATTAKFHLVDLAGSERSKKTQAEGDRFKEGVTINAGLLALGNVIAALGDGGRQMPSYRNSKLTRLLQDSLGGNSMTLMIACISPADYNLLETVNTLRYADRARHIKNKPVVNQDPKSAEIAALKMKVEQLQLQLAGQGGVAIEASADADPALAIAVKELESKLRNLRQSYNETLVENAEMRERLLMAESTQDRIREQLHQLSKEMQSEFIDLQTTALPNGAKDRFETLKKIFSEKVLNLIEEQKRGEEEQRRHESLHDVPLDHSTTAETDNADELKQLDEHQEKHTLKQCELKKELREITKQLLLKEERWEQYAKTNVIAADTFQQSLALKLQYEKQISELEKEKSELMHSIKLLQEANKEADAKAKQTELMKKNTQIETLQKKVAEQAKIVKQKELAEKKVQELSREILNMKQLRVKLIKQMKSESEQWKIWRTTREREAAQLRDQARKRSDEMQRMQMMHVKQQNVSKRKLEQAVAANKRLKEAMAKQKAVRSQRDMKGNKEQVQEFVAREVEVLVSTVDAERSLQLLLEDRAALTAELAALRRLTSDAVLKQRIASVQQEVELRSAQIADLQQKLVDSDQENKTKTRWDVVGSMADAKVALSHAVRLAADIRRDALKREASLQEAQQRALADQQKAEEERKNVENALRALKNEMEKQRDIHTHEVNLLERERLEILQDLLQNKENKENVPIEELRKKEQEVNSLQDRLDTILSVTVTPRNKKRRSREFEDLNVSSDGTYVDDNDDDKITDPDWRKTPLGKRLASMKSARSSNNLSINQSKIARKRSVVNDSLMKCGCLSHCDTKRCICYRMRSSCGDRCSCNPAKCQYKLATILEGSSVTVNDESSSLNLNRTFVMVEDSSLSKKRKVSAE